MTSTSPPDLLSPALADLRVSGAIVLRHRYAPPWAVQIPDSQELARLTSAPPHRRVVAFHHAEAGEFQVVGGRERVRVGAGELAVCFGGQPHRLKRKDNAKAVPLADILLGRRSPRPSRGEAGSTSLVCGVFVLRGAALNPLLEALPPIVHARVDDGPLASVARVVHGELDERRPGSSFMLERALELLCAALIRDHAQDGIGWFAAIRDEQIRRALEPVHRDPGGDWTVAALAKRAHLSRSRFAARFRELLGVSPMEYITRWRMNVAARLLEDRSLSVDDVAARVGYAAAPAFSRAFKRYIGEPPARYRRLEHEP